MSAETTIEHGMRVMRIAASMDEALHEIEKRPVACDADFNARKAVFCADGLRMLGASDLARVVIDCHPAGWAYALDLVRLNEQRRNAR